MTTIEVMRTIRMLLDDSRDWYPTSELVVDMVNDAQIRKIHEYYIKMDERALRPLYQTTLARSNGAIIQDANGRHLLYPRACRMNLLEATGEYSVLARYVEPETYFNYTPPGMLPGDSFPRTAYYTITKQYAAGTGTLTTYLWVSDTGAVADLLWIYDPPVFVYDEDDEGNNVTLSLPVEYHHEVCLLAAELINNIDVGEMERGMAVFQNQRLTIDKLDES